MTVAALGILAVGLVFDSLTLIAGISSLMTRQYSSGFLYVAPFFYAGFSLVAPLEQLGLSAPGEPTRGSIFLALTTFHALCLLPGWWAARQRRRSQ